ncbi:unnamed protein product [Gadus morhua 'NCC']
MGAPRTTRVAQRPLAAAPRRVFQDEESPPNISATARGKKVDLIESSQKRAGSLNGTQKKSRLHSGYPWSADPLREDMTLKAKKADPRPLQNCYFSPSPELAPRSDCSHVPAAPGLMLEKAGRSQLPSRHLQMLIFAALPQILFSVSG